MTQAAERTGWQDTLDDLMVSILRQPQAVASKERKVIFEAWRKRMEERFGIGHPTRTGRPPLSNLIRDERDANFLERRLAEIYGLARHLKRPLLAGQILAETKSTPSRRRESARRNNPAPIRLLNRYEAQGVADELKKAADEHKKQETALLHVTTSLQGLNLQQSLSHH